MSLIQLIYVSDLVNQDEAAIAPILASAVRHNAENGITGMLLYARGNFLQVLEGEPAAVEATYARILQDPRHQNATLLTRDAVSERHFPDWRMGYRALSPEQSARLPHYAPYFEFGFDALAIQAHPGVALEMLELFGNGMI
jgi:hypothetical protein